MFLRLRPPSLAITCYYSMCHNKRGHSHKCLSHSSQNDVTHCNSPTGIVLAHAYEHVEHECCQVGLVEYGLAGGHELPLELRHGVQRAPAVHALRPAARLRRHDALAPEILHLFDTYTHRSFTTYSRAIACELHCHSESQLCSKWP